jgi:hypothetical protein
MFETVILSVRLGPDTKDLNGELCKVRCRLELETKKGTMLAHRARVSLLLYFVISLLLYFFGLDSGGTIPASR